MLRGGIAVRLLGLGSKPTGPPAHGRHRQAVHAIVSVQSDLFPGIEAGKPGMRDSHGRADRARPPLMLVDQRLAKENGKIERARPLRLLLERNSKAFYGR